MNAYKKVAVNAGAFIILILLLAIFSRPVLEITGLVVALSIVVTAWLLPKRNIFSLVITAIVLYGFALIFWRGCHKGEDLPSQGELLLHHFLFSASLIVLWLFFYSLKKLAVDEKKESFDNIHESIFRENTSVLTPEVFEQKAKLFLYIMKERKEKGYFFRFVPHGIKYIEECVLAAINKAIVEAVKNHHFHFATKDEEGSLVVFIGNVEEHEVNGLLTKIEEGRRTEMRTESAPYMIYRTPVLNYDLATTKANLYEELEGV